MAKPENVKVAQPRDRTGGQSPGGQSLWRRGHAKVDLGAARRAGLHADIPPMWESVRRIERPEDVPGVPALRKRDALQRRTLGVVDVTAAYLALLVAVYARQGRPHVALAVDRPGGAVRGAGKQGDRPV